MKQEEIQNRTGKDVPVCMDPEWEVRICLGHGRGFQKIRMRGIRNMGRTLPGPASPDEREAQRCDPRSFIGEMSPAENDLIRIEDTDPEAGGRRMYRYAGELHQRQIRQVNERRLHEPNKKALHLSSATKQWKAAQTSLAIMEETTGLDEERREAESMNWQEAVMLSCYSAVACIECFVSEKLAGNGSERENAEDARGLAEKLKNVMPRVTKKPRPTQTRWWNGLMLMLEARNRMTHGASTSEKNAEELNQAWDIALKPDMNPPELAKRVMEHFSDEKPWWIRKTIAHALESMDH